MATLALALALGTCGRPPARRAHVPADDAAADDEQPDVASARPDVVLRPDTTRDLAPEPGPDEPDGGPMLTDAVPDVVAVVDGASGGPDVVAAGPAACPALTGGWTAYAPKRTIQFEGGDSFCTYQDEGGIELFRMMKNPAGVIQRCEARVANDYNSGVNQFEGDVRVTAGNATCVHQVFKFLMLVVYPQNGGTLTQHTGTFVAAPIDGKWLHVNTIHDVATGKTDIYIDCVKKVTMNALPPTGPNGWYDKYGLYAINGEPPRDEVAQVEWKNVRYYRK
jgi:hypothetical protein